MLLPVIYDKRISKDSRDERLKNSAISLRGMIYASLFGAGTTAGAYIIIPLPPVPITLQTLFVGLAGALLGARLGALSQVIYLLIGIIGLPVFNGGKAGLGVLLGPTGGYLIGFVAGAWVIGALVNLKKSPGFAWTVAALVAGTLVVYLLGVAQLCVVAKLSLNKAIAVGVLPFLIGDLVKILATAFVVQKIRPRFRLQGPAA
jgi:biotin transport system substrate-specific component